MSRFGIRRCAGSRTRISSGSLCVPTAHAVPDSIHGEDLTPEEAGSVHLLRNRPSTLWSLHFGGSLLLQSWGFTSAQPSHVTLGQSRWAFPRAALSHNCHWVKIREQDINCHWPILCSVDILGPSGRVTLPGTHHFRVPTGASSVSREKNLRFNLV